MSALSAAGLSIRTGPALDTEPALTGRPLTLAGFLAEVVTRDPSHDAFVTPDTRLTYGQLRDRSHALARGLVASGAGKGTRVALLLPNGPEWAVGLFACALIGAVPVAVNALVGYEDLEYMLQRSDTQLMLTCAPMLDRLGRATGPENNSLLDQHPLLRPGSQAGRDLVLPAFQASFDIRRPELERAGDLVPAELIDALGRQVMPEDDALIMFTSGSTGRPKAVLHMNRAICIQSWRWPRLMAISPVDRMWSTSPFFWTSGLVRTLGCVLAAGATLVLQEHFEPGEALTLLARERVTVMLSRPHLDNRLLEHPDFDEFDLSALRRLEERSPLRQRLQDTDPWVYSGYGMTETMTLISSTELNETASAGAIGNGPPLVGMEVKIIDTDTGHVVSVGTAGRICARGVTMMRGYYKVPREEVFDADGWFHTSDAGFLDDRGNVHWTGRLDDTAKIAGVNVHPMEVERQLARWGRLAAYAVLTLPHPSLGAAMVICAVLTSTDGDDAEQLTEAMILSYLRSQLAGYQVPRRVLLFESTDLTFTATQKIDLRAMRAKAVDRMVADQDGDGEWSAYLRDLRSSGQGLTA
jgi:fatty-acyl-CoA synthase